MKCNITNKNVEEIMSFGKMPIANGFLHEEDKSKEYFYEMTVGLSPEIGLFQLTNFPKVEMMFHDEYPFFTNSSNYMKKHFKEYAEWILKEFIDNNADKIVEIGCNDGTMLQNFKDENIDSLGIDPSGNVAKIANDKGLNIINDFFSENLSNTLDKFKSKTKVICAANVICHIPDLDDLIKGIDKLLSKKGVFIFEEPYLGAMINNVSYDQIYDEHIYIFSAISVEKIFNLYDFELIDLYPQITHGGSMRYVLARKNEYTKSLKVNKILDEELKKGFLDIDLYMKFKKNCLRSKERLNDLIDHSIKKNHRVGGYAATSKSTTILNFCSINKNKIECIYDTTPEKIGKLSPGTHIPIIDSNEFKVNPPETCLLFGWNHKKEILEKEKKFEMMGGKWISHIENFF
tara:strand:+ start:576 stop:1784 length:1209 start_codon:yes stop_codon:yes gene_type:complete